jgi:hypothetical protein
MNIILTEYIYPIEFPIQLSEKLGLYFDNPRTEEEIETVRDYIKVSMNSPNKMYHYDTAMRLPVSAPLRQSLSRFGIKNKKDAYKKRFLKENSKKDIFRLFSKMWIVLRYNDEGEFQSLRTRSEEYEKDADKKGKFIIMLGNDNPIVKNENIATDYSFLLSLLINTEEDYFGSNFLLHDSHFDLNEPKIDKDLNRTILYWTFYCYQADKEKKDESQWKVDFPFIKDKMVATANTIDNILDDKSTDKLLYVASMLKLCADEIKDTKMKLVTLVSIIELLLTHAPDFKRYNIEDSISKQFKLKLSILMYQNDNSVNLIELNKRLSELYSQRSNIAHGNFREYEKVVLKEAKKITDAEEWSDIKGIASEKFVLECYKYIKVIIQAYIKDRNFVDYLKDN